jgi:Sulfotransferase domain
MSGVEKNQKVFGIGLSKTGTTSLTKALNILAIHSIHCPWDEKTFAELQRGEYRLSILNEYQGVTDTPVAPFFAQLDRAWPGSKFILTVRDKASWLRSVETHWKTIKEGRHANDQHFQNFADFVSACVYGCIYFNAERFSYAYDTHVRLVRDYFESRPGDLLVLDVCGGTGGWPELCGFLGQPLPKNIPFPHEYRTDRGLPFLLDAKRELAAVAAEGETIIIIDQEELDEELTAGRRRLPFLERGGVYWGNPSDDAVAVRELERLRTESGATFLAIAWPAFWWFKHYVRFTAHVQSKYDCVLRNERLVVWALR